MRIAVLGAGAWGTALAVHAAQRHDVLLWARDAALVDALARERANARYLAAQPLPERLVPTAELAEAVRFAGTDGLVVVATAMAGLGPVTRALAGLGQPRAPLAWLCKGIERGDGTPGSERLAHEVVAEALGADWTAANAGALSGPSFAQEVAAGLPVALVAASRGDAMPARAVAALHHDACRVYTSDDVIGVELAGALKNVIAIAAGTCDGLALGHNARAALITRGLAEMTRLGLALGARPETFTGLAGIGDLMLTCTGDLSRNRRVGLGLAAGRTLAGVLEDLGHVAEGVPTARAAARFARERGVELPIVEAVNQVLFHDLPARDAVASLLGRSPRSELE